MRNSSAAFQLLVTFTVVVADSSSRSNNNRCVELNFQAAAVQSSDSCALLRTVVTTVTSGRDSGDNGGGIFANNGDDITINMPTNDIIDATCGFRLEDIEKHVTCVEGVVDVVDGMADEGCELTGGETLANFISTVNDNHEGFAFLIQLACNKSGECFGDIRRAIEYCNDYLPAEEGEESCMSYVSCECLTDLLSVIETTTTTYIDNFLGLDDVITDSIGVAGTACRCENLNNRAFELESRTPSCALAAKIVEDDNIFGGDTDAVDDTCNAKNDVIITTTAPITTATCVEDVSVVVDGFIEYGCAVTEDANADFMYPLKYDSETFETITDFACSNNNCYISLRTCHYYYQYDNTCMKSLSCDCKRDFLKLVRDLPPDSKDDYLKISALAMDEIQTAVDVECACDDINARASSLRMEGYCALQRSVVEGGYMFAGNSTDIQSTCRERTSCVGNITEVVGQITDLGCEINPDNDGMAKFLYTLNDNSEWNEITHFICNSDDDACYDEIEAVVEDCKSNAMDACTGSAKPHCLGSFIDMVDRLSDDSKSDLVGIDASTLSRIRSWNVSKTTSPTAQPATIQPTSGAIFRASPTAIIISSMLLALVFTSTS